MRDILPHHMIVALIIATSFFGILLLQNTSDTLSIDAVKSLLKIEEEKVGPTSNARNASKNADVIRSETNLLPFH